MKHPFLTTEYLSDGIGLNIQFKEGRPWIKKKFKDEDELVSWLIRKGFYNAAKD